VVALIALLLGGGTGAAPAFGQTARDTGAVAVRSASKSRAAPGADTTRRDTEASRPAAAWSVVMDGEETDWPGADRPTAPVDSVRAVARRLTEALQDDGYYYASVDSARVDTAARPPRVRLFARRGPQVRLGSIRLTGTRAVPSEELRRLMETRTGRPLDPERLEGDINAMLRRYDEAGHPLARIRVAETTLRPGPPPRLDVALAVEEGAELWLRRVELPDGSRTDPDYVAEVAGLEPGAPLTGYDEAALRQALRESNLFRSVGRPELRVGPDGGAVLFVPVEETSPGSFDLVLGYLPASRAGGGGQVVGSGSLDLENVFGGGRTADLALDRRPGQGSLVDVGVADPYVLGRPIQVEARFRGEQRDSTFGERLYRVGLGYRFDGGLEVVGTASREVTRPGQAGAQIRAGRQRVARSTSFFYGVGLRYHGVDRARNPRRGLHLDVHVEQGTRDRRRQRVTADGDTTLERSSLRQERLRATVRGYLPLFDRQVVAVGGDASFLLSDGYDRSDLFRLGGAQSLRGYDEDRFLGNAVGRALLEYRVQVDRVSYAYAFGDLGYVRRPALGTTEASQGWHPGYGIGIQFGTRIGIVNASYALQPADSPANGRIHLGLSFGL
jgi:outer membrane protein assembly factor BamA